MTDENNYIVPGNFVGQLPTLNTIPLKVQKSYHHITPLKQLNPHNHSNVPSFLKYDQFLIADSIKKPLSDAANDDSRLTDSPINKELSFAKNHLNEISENQDAVGSYESEDDNEVFYESSPVLFNDQLHPVSSDSEYYPTLLSETLKPTVKVYIDPHMTKPLPQSIDLKFDIHDSELLLDPLVAYAPFSDLNEESDEMKLLNVLQLEIENLEEEPKAFSWLDFINLSYYNLRCMIFGMSDDEYFEKYPWAKFFHEEESEEGEEEEQEEGDEYYNDSEQD